MRLSWILRDILGNVTAEDGIRRGSLGLESGRFSNSVSSRNSPSHMDGVWIHLSR